MKKQTNKDNKKTGNVAKSLAVGAGVVAAGTAAYMLLGPNGKKNRAKVKKFVNKAKSEMMNNKKVKDMATMVKAGMKMVKSDAVSMAKKAKKVVKKVAKKAKNKK